MNNCASSALFIKTYYAGKNQATHPSVITFETPWHGYRYYMAYTAYPFANGAEENPCLAVSNDGMHWNKPPRLVNPISTCEETECDELKDVDLLYRDDLDRIEIWYLGRIQSSIQEGGPLYLFRKFSSDGVNWSDRETVCCVAMVSPSVIWDNDKKQYTIWFIQHNKKDSKLLQMFSADAVSWTEPEQCEIPDKKDFDIWHGSVNIIDNLYVFTFVGLKKPHNQSIYSCTSKDGHIFNQVAPVIQNHVGWKFLYRPCVVKIENMYQLFYGVTKLDNTWLITYSKGPSLTQLEGYREKVPPILKPEHSKLFFKTIHHSVISMFPSSICLIIPFLMLVCCFSISALYQWILFCLISIVFRFSVLKDKAIIHCFIAGIANGTVLGGSLFLLKKILLNE